MAKRLYNKYLLFILLGAAAESQNANKFFDI